MPTKHKITDDERLDKVLSISTPVLKWFGLYQSYVIKFNFVDEFDGSRGGEVVARVEEDYPYRLITIQFQRKYIDNNSPFTIEGALIHEILHPLISGPMDRYLEGRMIGWGKEYNDLQESLVDLIRIWLVRLRPEKGWN